MKSKVSILFFIPIFFFTSLAFSNETKAYLVGEGYSQEEIDCLENALRISPDNFGTYYGLGIAYYRKGEYAKVIECYENFFKLPKPDTKKGILNLEAAYRGMKGELPLFSRSKEIESLIKAIRVNPRFALFYIYLAGLPPLNTKTLEEEIGYLKRAFEINPDNFGTYYGLGVAYYRKGEYDKAIECLLKFTEANPDCSLTYYGLGVAYYKLGQIAKTLEQAVVLLASGHNNLAKELVEVVGVDEVRRYQIRGLRQLLKAATRP